MDTAFRDTVPKENSVVTEMCMQDRLFTFEGERKKKNMIIKFLWGANWMEGSDVATTFSSKIGFP